MQIHALELITPAATNDPVVTATTAKLALRIDGTDLDTEIERLVRSATAQAQTEMRRAILTQTWALRLDCFPSHGVIELPFGCTSVTSVTYYDDANASQTLSSSLYVVDVASAPGRLARADGTTWPTTYRRPNAVTVTMVCGFGGAVDVPEEIKDWIIAHVGSRIRNPEAFMQGPSVSAQPNRFIDGLLDQWRLTVV
jgi:uncharacterized phiE125 gp8 family phage protein